jgi:phosphatidylserine/phosphatidylglycerophosphate/cardiolipin synthase-like enzyme
MNIIYKEELVNELKRLIDNSEKFLSIVSPYFEIWPEIYDSFKKLIEKNVKIKIFVRDDKRNKFEYDYMIETIKKLKIEIYSIKQLHAKIYINEKKAIIGSINITENAFSKSEEIGGITNNDNEYKQIKDILENNIMNKINPVEEKIQSLVNKFKSKNIDLDIKLNNSNELIIKHHEYKLRLFMDKTEEYNQIFKGGYFIVINFESEKKIHLIYKNIPDIRDNVYNIEFQYKKWDEKIFKANYKRIFCFPEIESLLELEFDYFEYNISFLIKAIEEFIYN